MVCRKRTMVINSWQKSTITKRHDSQQEQRLINFRQTSIAPCLSVQWRHIYEQMQVNIFIKLKWNTAYGTTKNFIFLPHINQLLASLLIVLLAVDSKIVTFLNTGTIGFVIATVASFKGFHTHLCHWMNGCKATVGVNGLTMVLVWQTIGTNVFWFSKPSVPMVFGLANHWYQFFLWFLV